MPIDQLLIPAQGIKAAGVVAIDSVLANDLVGYTLVNELGQRIGNIEDVVVNLDVDSVVYMALDFGEVLGVGERMIPVPFDDIWYHLSQQTVTIYDLNRQAIEQHDGFDTANWPQEADRDWNRPGQQQG
jgi:sporulation protein YlmC with PRC-barrel domain